MLSLYDTFNILAVLVFIYSVDKIIALKFLFYFFTQPSYIALYVTRLINLLNNTQQPTNNTLFRDIFYTYTYKHRFLFIIRHFEFFTVNTPGGALNFVCLYSFLFYYRSVCIYLIYNI